MIQIPKVISILKKSLRWKRETVSKGVLPWSMMRGCRNFKSKMTNRRASCSAKGKKEWLIFLGMTFQLATKMKKAVRNLIYLRMILKMKTYRNLFKVKLMWDKLIMSGNSKCFKTKFITRIKKEIAKSLALTTTIKWCQ